MTDSFTKELLKFSAKTGQRIVGVSQNIALDAMEEIIEGTPVDTGKARRNWRVRLNRPANGVLKGKDKEGDKAARAGIKVIGRAKPGSTIYITNNLFYVRFLEDGTANRRPLGFIENVRNRFNTIAFNATVKAKRQYR